MTQWNVPIDFSGVDLITPEHINKYLMENARYLFKRKRGVVRQTGASGVAFDSTNSTSYVKLTGIPQLTIRLDRQADVRLWMNFHTIHTDINNRMTFIDIKIDDTTFISSNTGTALSSGVYHYTGQSGTNKQVSLDFVYEDLAAGYHTFDVWWKTNLDTVYAYDNPAYEFGVMEI